MPRRGFMTEMEIGPTQEIFLNSIRLTTELHRCRLRHFVCARLIRRRIGLDLVRFHEIVGQEKCFHFFTADVWQHPSVDLDAWAEHLAALLNHLLTLIGVIDDVAIFKGQVIFAHDGAHTLAPATGRFQISYNLRFSHIAGNLEP